MKKFKSFVAVILTFTSIFAQAAASTPMTSVQAFKQASEGDINGLTTSLAKLDINQRNERGETLAMSAAGNGQVQALQLILLKKPDLNLLDKDNHSALYYAISNQHAPTAKLLIESGANLLHLNERKDNALILAASINDSNLIALIIKADKAIVNEASNSGKTALMESARYGNAETLKKLIEAGAKKELKNKQGRTALDIAKKAQNQAAIKLLSSK